MIGKRQSAPAFVRRAFCIWAALIALAIPAAAQRGNQPPPSYAQFGAPDQEEGKRILEQFRAIGIAGDYYLEFQLRVMPRRGNTRTYSGRMWGSVNELGPVTRVSLMTAEGEQRLLVQDAPEPGFWHWRGGKDAKVEVLSGSALFTPVVQTDLTPFDLGRPYLYWKDFIFEGVARVGSRPAHQFLLKPPVEFTAKYPALTGVRIFLDTQFRALVKTELLGPNGRATKTMSVLDLKKVGEQWIVKSIDLRDETTRNKTRFQVTGVALNQRHPAETFQPATLAREINSVPPANVTKINP